MFIEVLPRSQDRSAQLLNDFVDFLAAGGEYCMVRGMRGTSAGVEETWRGAGGRPAAPRLVVKLTRIMLTKAKPNCGAHPGECPVGTRKPMSRNLEWDDRVRFNDLLNSFLDGWLRPGEKADVWTKPLDAPIPGTGKLFYIRKDNVPRVRWDWKELPYKGRMVRLWDFGSPSQFEAVQTKRRRARKPKLVASARE